MVIGGFYGIPRVGVGIEVVNHLLQILVLATQCRYTSFYCHHYHQLHISAT